MADQVVLCLCCACSMRQPDMSTKGEAKERVQLLFKSNHGMLKFKVYLSYVRITARKKSVLGICFRHYGFLIYSCTESRITSSGLCFVQMQPKDSAMYRGRSLIKCTKSKKVKVQAECKLMPKNYGSRSLKVKLRLELRTCYKKIVQTENLTKIIQVS